MNGPVKLAPVVLQLLQVELDALAQQVAILLGQAQTPLQFRAALLKQLHLLPRFEKLFVELMRTPPPRSK